MIWDSLGFRRNKDFFEKIIQDGRIGHAYLFTGQEMIGKKSFALDVAKLVLNSGSLENNPNLFIVGNKENISVDDIRGFKKFFSLKPYSGRYKVGIIDDCHLMTEEAANALLKVLEEPPQYSLIILVTANPAQLLPTVRSRCEEIKFPPHAKDEILKFLAGLGLDQRQSEFLADFSNGRIGLAYRLKERDNFKEIKEELTRFNKLLKSDINERFGFAEKVLKDETLDLSRTLLYWIFYLRSDLSKKLKINRARVLKNLLEVNYILSKPQYNHRLAFENFLLSL